MRVTSCYGLSYFPINIWNKVTKNWTLSYNKYLMQIQQQIQLNRVVKM